MSRRRDKNAGQRAEARQRTREESAQARVEGPGYSGPLAMIRMIEEPVLRVVFCNLAPEFRAAWCRTPGALHRRGLMPRLAAGLVTFDARGRCAS